MRINFEEMPQGMQCETRTIEEIIESDEAPNEFVYDWLNPLIDEIEKTKINRLFVFKRETNFEKLLLETRDGYSNEPYFLCFCFNCKNDLILSLTEIIKFYCDHSCELFGSLQKLQLLCRY